MLLHLVFRNPDGSLTPGSVWALATITVVWGLSGLIAIARPQFAQRYFTDSFGIHLPITVLRLAAIPGVLVGVAVAVFVVTASPGRLY